MSDVPPNDDGQNAPVRGELTAASTIVRFYTFADRCMDWAKTTRSNSAEDSVWSDGSEVSGRRSKAAYGFATS